MPKRDPMVHQLADVSGRRDEVLARGEGWRPTDGEMKRIGQKALWLEGAGYTVKAIASRLGVPDYTVRRALSRARAETFSTEDREETRQRVLLGLEELHEEAVAAGNLGEARKALMDMARVTGIVSTGGNVLVGVKVQQHLSDGELERRLSDWLDREGIEAPADTG